MLRVWLVCCSVLLLVGCKNGGSATPQQSIQQQQDQFAAQLAQARQQQVDARQNLAKIQSDFAAANKCNTGTSTQLDSANEQMKKSMDEFARTQSKPVDATGTNAKIQAAKQSLAQQQQAAKDCAGEYYGSFKSKGTARQAERRTRETRRGPQETRSDNSPHAPTDSRPRRVRQMRGCPTSFHLCASAHSRLFCRDSIPS